MICQHCINAGHANSQGNIAEAERLHRNCFDVDCFCQHATGRGWIADAVKPADG